MVQSNNIAKERQVKMFKLRELLDNNPDEYFSLLKSMYKSEFYSENIMFEDVRILDLYHEVRPLYAELFGREGCIREMNHLGAYSSFEEVRLVKVNSNLICGILNQNMGCMIGNLFDEKLGCMV